MVVSNGVIQISSCRVEVRISRVVSVLRLQNFLDLELGMGLVSLQVRLNLREEGVLVHL